MHPTKLGVRPEGSTIELVHVNGNLIIILCEVITEHINVCRDLLYCWPFHMPLWRQLLAWIVLRFSLFTSDPFSPPHIRVSCSLSFSGSILCLFIYGRASLAMEGKSVVPMEMTFMDNRGRYNLCYRIKIQFYMRRSNSTCIDPILHAKIQFYIRRSDSTCLDPILYAM